MRWMGFVAAGLLVGVPGAAPAQSTTTGEAWTKIQHRYAEAPQPNTVDTLKGNYRSFFLGSCRGVKKTVELRSIPTLRKRLSEDGAPRTSNGDFRTQYSWLV